MLDTGDAAPEVEAQNQDGETVTPAFSAPMVVYFYPRDGTPGCQLEARQFQDELPEFQDLGATVYGVSTDDVDSHREFADEEALAFDLLADPDGEVAAAFGLDTEGGYVNRITFVLADGTVQAVVDADDVNPDGHAAAVRERVADL
ncbi:peroxiredoxin [Halorientalis pallida]|uniref:thioredoxin-dependent peroxiredoxin n=1 Tax=Halorientalis pallida TaxID=2479928 RepID=A0A498KX12_9EURY|nr:peroxiredoxin [Halorientalis pallida]RXK46460.1 peroxiredoxin [Halorientalis pallida]